MRELSLTAPPTIELRRSRTVNAGFPLSRAAFVASILVHVAAGYALSRHVFSGAPLPSPRADFVWFEAIPVPRVEPEPVAPSEPAPQVIEPATAPAPTVPAPRAAQVEPAPTATLPSPALESTQRTAEALEPPEVPAELLEPRRGIEALDPLDLEVLRQRAAAEAVERQASTDSFLTFSLDDVVEPRPAAEPKPPRSIFDLGSRSGSRPSVMQPGQARTKFGHKLASLCNALTGGFGVAFQGFGLFTACASPNDEPTGLFPEVRPAWMDLKPECVETRPLAPLLDEESPFPTVKCRLVPKESWE